MTITNSPVVHLSSVTALTHTELYPPVIYSRSTDWSGNYALLETISDVRTGVHEDEIIPEVWAGLVKLLFDMTRFQK